MSRRTLAALAAGIALAAALSPTVASAQSAGTPHVIKFAGKAAPAPAGTSHGVSPRASTGLTAAIAAASTGARTFSLDATKSADTASTITSYAFDFGNGSSTVTNATGTANYEYAQPGTYTVTVTVQDAAGNTATATTSVTTLGSDYTPYGPVRLLDTRNGTGESAAAKIAADSSIQLKIAGNGSIPTGVTAVVLTLTATEETSGGNIIAYADGPSRPSTSNLNFGPDQNIAAMATVTVGSDGDIDLYNDSAGTTDLLADVSGYFTQTAASGYTPLTTDRILDTRTTTGGHDGVVAADGTVTLTVAGADGDALPTTGITAVALNLTTTSETSNGDIIAYADGSTLPATSNLNYVEGTNVADYAIVPVGSDGKIDLYNGSAGTTNLIADVSGYYSTSSPSSYVPVTPTRSLDTRTLPDGIVYADTAAQDSVLTSSLNNATAYAVTATVTSTTGGGDLIIYPAGDTLPTSSNLNWASGDTVANAFNAIPSSTGIYLYNESTGTAEFLVDEYGYYSAI